MPATATPTAPSVVQLVSPAHDIVIVTVTADGRVYVTINGQSRVPYAG